MSVSINSNYPNLYGNWTTASITNSMASTQQTSTNSESAFKDYMQLATSTQSISSGNYSSSTTDLASLTTEQKIAYLETMLKRLESTDSKSSNLPESLQAAMNTVSDLLSNFDASNSSEEEVSELFAAVTETLEKAKPSKAEMQANGMTPPPPPLNNTAIQMDDTSSETSTGLSVDQMKVLISNLIDTLNGEDDSTNVITNTLSPAITDQLSNYDETTATDEETQTLFDNLMKLLETNQQSTLTDTNAVSSSEEIFPSSIQMTGTSLPPFNWNPNITV